MQLSLRPYLTAGVAIAGASVIAVAPIQPIPTDIQIPNPTVQVVRDVQLTADEIETAVNDLVFQFTELGLSLTVPLTAALIEAIAPDLIPEGSTAEEVATVLLLGLSGYAISGGGSIGTALQDVVDAFECPSTGGVCENLGAGYLALLVGAPATIIEGYVLGGFGPDLAPLLMSPSPIFAGGLIQNPGLLQGPVLALGLPAGFQLCLPGLGCGSNLEVGDTVLPSFFFTAGSLLQGVLDAVDIGALGSGSGLLGGLLDNLPGLGLPGLTSLTGSNTNSIASTENTLTPKNERLTVDVATDLGAARGKHAAPDVSFAAPLSGLPGEARAAQAAKDVVGVVGGTAPTDRDQTFGRDVAEAASQGRANGGTNVVRDSLSFVPETGKKSGGNSGGSNRAGATLSSTAKNFGDAVSGAVKGALGGGSKDGGSKDDAGAK